MLGRGEALRVKMHDSRSCLSGGDVLGRGETLRVTVKMHDSRSWLSGGDVLRRGETLRHGCVGLEIKKNFLFS